MQPHLLAIDVIGLFVPMLRVLYDYAWFVGFFVALGLYAGLMHGRRARVPYQ